MKPEVFDREVGIEMLAELGPVTSRIVADELGCNQQTALDSLKRMVGKGILERGDRVLIVNSWTDTFIIAGSRPKQASMFANVKRDKLVAALFGNYTPAEGAAWVF